MPKRDPQATKALKTARANENRMKLLKPTRMFPLPIVMTTPPTVTVTKSDTSGITNSQKVSSGIPATTNINPIFRYAGEVKRADWNGTTYSGIFPDYSYVKNIIISGSTGSGSGMMDVEFVVDDTVFEIIVSGKGQSTSYRVLVDEGQGYQSVFADPAPTSIPADNGNYLLKVTFATKAIRRIRFQSANCGFGGVNIGPNGTVLPATRPSTSKVIIFGDSFTEGTGADGWFNGYAPTIGQMLGMDYWVSGSGGTGYISSNSGLFRVKYQDRIQKDIIDYKPDLVIIQGGQNDTTFLKADIQAAADLLYKTLKTRLPNVPVITISNIGISTTTTAMTDCRDAIKTAALANGVALIDSIDGSTYDFKGNVVTSSLGNWLTGNGNTGNPQVTGNRSFYNWTDNGHPSNAGHRYIGERVAGEVFKLLNLI